MVPSWFEIFGLSECLACFMQFALFVIIVACLILIFLASLFKPVSLDKTKIFEFEKNY